MSTGQSLHTLSGHTERIYAVAFSPDGKQAVTGSDDDTLKLWNALSGEQIADLSGHDGKYLLSGSWDKTIRLWDAKSGRFVKVMVRQGTRVDSLSISPDGKSVLTSYGNTGSINPCHIFTIPEGTQRQSFTQHENIVLATAISPDGRLAATGGGDDQEIYLWDARTGTVKQKLVGQGNVVWSVGFAKDGRSIAWGKTWGSRNLFAQGSLEQRFYLTESDGSFRLSIGEALTQDTGYIRGIESVGGISIRTQDGNIHPTLQILQNGQTQYVFTRGSTDGYDHRSLTLTPDGKIAISGGSNGFLSAYSTQTGDKLHDFIGHTGDVLGVAVSPDGKWLVSGSADQTVRLWDIASGSNLLTVFHTSDGEWVAWTPDGYYDSSANGDRYIGWHINQGEDRAARYYPASAFADRFRKPRVVANYLKTNGSIDEAIRLANAQDPRHQRTEQTQIAQINTLLPPDVFFTDPSNADIETTDAVICVQAGAESPSGLPVQDIWLTLDGQSRGIVRINKPSGGKQPTDPKKRISGTSAHIDQCLELPLGESRIAVFASSQDRTSEPRILRVTRKPGSKPLADDIYKPNLYVLSIGVSIYRNSAYNLDLAHKDAQAIADAFQAQEGKLYRQVKARLLLNEQATGGNILDGLDWILKESTQKDMSVIFMAGHGENDEGNNYYFIPHDGDRDNLRRTGVKWFDFQDVISRLPSKRLFMIDTCRSGNVTGKRRGASDMTEALRELIQTQSGAVVMTASTGAELSAERLEWGHGAFTKAVIEGLRDFRADNNGDNTLDIKELDFYVTYRVKDLTGGAQHPTTEIPQTLPNFPIAVK